MWTFNLWKRCISVIHDTNHASKQFSEIPTYAWIKRCIQRPLSLHLYNYFIKKKKNSQKKQSRNLSVLCIVVVSILRGVGERWREGRMLDINLFREEKGHDPERIRESQRRRFADVALVDHIILLDKQWRQRSFIQSFPILRPPP